MVRCLTLLAVLLLACTSERADAVRTRLRDRDVACTDRAKPVAYHYAVPQDAYRSGCYDVRVKGAVDPQHPDDQLLDELVFCCPR